MNTSALSHTDVVHLWGVGVILGLIVAAIAGTIAGRAVKRRRLRGNLTQVQGKLRRAAGVKTDPESNDPDEIRKFQWQEQKSAIQDLLQRHEEAVEHRNMWQATNVLGMLSDALSDLSPEQLTTMMEEVGFSLEEKQASLSSKIQSRYDELVALAPTSKTSVQDLCNLIWAVSNSSACKMGLLARLEYPSGWNLWVARNLVNAQPGHFVGLEQFENCSNIGLALRGALILRSRNAEDALSLIAYCESHFVGGYKLPLGLDDLIAQLNVMVAAELEPAEQPNRA